MYVYDLYMPIALSVDVDDRLPGFESWLHCLKAVQT